MARMAAVPSRACRSSRVSDPSTTQRCLTSHGLASSSRNSRTDGSQVRLFPFIDNRSKTMPLTPQVILGVSREARLNRYLIRLAAVSAASVVTMLGQAPVQPPLGARPAETDRFPALPAIEKLQQTQH